jgi:hypothetical protein
LPVLLLSAAVARASDPGPRSVRATLDWDRGDDASCATRDDVAAGVETRVGHPVFVRPGAGARIRVSGAVSKRADAVGWTTRIEVRDAMGRMLGERVLVSDDERCDSGTEATILVTAIMLDYAIQAIAMQPAEPPPGAQDEPSPAPPSRSIELGADVETALGEGLDASIGPRASVMTASGFSAYAAYRRSAVFSDRMVTTSLVDLGVGICLAGRSAPLRPWLSGCAAIEVGMMRARAEGYPVNKAEQGPWVAPVVTIQGYVPMSRPLAATAGLSLALPLVRDRFVLERSETHTVLFQADRVVPRALLGVRWLFD